MSHIKITKRFFIDGLITLMIALSFSPLYSNHGDLAEAEDFKVDAATGQSYPYTKTFTISAYYSPLPCQDRYTTGSYEGDIRLNGRGTNGADGTPVYPGMVAAPKTYAFGTKLYIPGVGTTAVHDRGGAIVAANGTPGVYDRLDIWMGYGDKGLTRALQWGKRAVDVTVYGLNDSIAEQITLSDYSPSEAIPNPCGLGGGGTTEEEEPVVEETPVVVPSQPEVPTEVVVPVTPVTPVETPVSSERLEEGDSGTQVKKLQEELATLNFFKGPTTGYYGQLTEHAVFKFQQSQNLVGDKSSTGAGVFGAKTKDRMNEIIASRKFRSGQTVASTKPVETVKVAFMNELEFGMIGSEVRALQTFLKAQGFFKGPFITDYFGPTTRQAVLDFQLAKGVVSSVNDIGAGRVGQATLAAINSI